MKKYCFIFLFLYLTVGCTHNHSARNVCSLKIIKFADNIDLSDGIKNESAENFVLLINELQDLDTLEFTSDEYDGIITSVIETITTNPPENESSSPDKLFLLKDLVEDYLGDSHSPVADNELYISFVQNLRNFETALYSETELSRAMQNRKGTKFPDIPVITPEGKELSLYEMDKKATLIFIEDPECSYCKDIYYEIINHDNIKHPLKENRLDILIANIRQINDSVDIRNLPCLYLINQEREVIEKNISPQKLISGGKII